MHQENLWTRVHLGRSGLQPLLGTYKPIKEVSEEESIHRAHDKRVSSFRLPPLSGPADIEFLRNKFGWCMPTADQVIKTQKLKLGYRGDLKETRSIFAEIGSTSTSSTKTSMRRRIHQFYARHHFVSKSSEQMDREKLIRKITNELKDYQNAVEYELTHPDRRPGERFSSFHLHPTNIGHAQRIDHVTSEIKHLERRQSEVNKISNRAKDSVNTHIVMMNKKLSEKISKDIELTHEVRSKLDLSKSLERLEKLTKISRLESLRQKLLHTTREELTTVQVEESSEEESSDEDVYKL